MPARLLNGRSVARSPFPAVALAPPYTHAWYSPCLVLPADMVNVVVHGVVFELQVVLKELMSCRKALHGHESFARTRCFAEALLAVGITEPLPIDAAASPQPAGSRGDAGVMAENAALRQSNASLLAEVRALKALLATKDQEIAALSARPPATGLRVAARGRTDSFFDRNGLQFDD